MKNEYLLNQAVKPLNRTPCYVIGKTLPYQRSCTLPLIPFKQIIYVPPRKCHLYPRPAPGSKEASPLIPILTSCHDFTPLCSSAFTPPSSVLLVGTQHRCAPCPRD